MAGWISHGCGVAAIAVWAFAAATPAAAITCKDGYQLVQGNYLATPYCQDDLLAKVARQYGMKAPASEIRNNPNFKRHVCRVVGRDIRVQLTCLDAGTYGRRVF
ncbi:MAG: hypothetical protein ABL893_02810 [Hyphomicrobium sp.]